MHILYFHQHFSTPEGATGTRSYEMAKKLIENGHKVTMVCGSNDVGTTQLKNPFKHGVRTGNIHGIEIIEFELKYSNSDTFFKRSCLFFLFALRSIKVALFTKADLVFATSTPLTAGIPGIFSRWIKGTPFVFEVRDLWPELPREMKIITNPIILKLMSFLEWASYKSAHRLIGLSPGIVKGIHRLNIKQDDITLIANGCDLEIFSKNKSPWIPKNVSTKDFKVIYTGTHGIANGLDAVLDAAAILKTQGHTNIKIILVGKGKLKPHLIDRATREGLTNVLFLDSVSKLELSGLMAGADLGLQVLANIPAFYYGTSPNKFFDYLSSGLPILTNYPGWVADLINKHKCGFAVDPQNPEAFADALCNAANRQKDLAEMGRNSLELAKLHFARDDMATNFVSWLEDAAQNKNGK